MRIAELFLLLVLVFQDPTKKDTVVTVESQRIEISREIQSVETRIKQLEDELSQQKERRLWLYGRLNEWNRLPDSTKVRVKK